MPIKINQDEKPAINLTPMIDVVFLLLAFFVVVSKMDPKPTVDLPIARYGKAVNEKEAIYLIVRYTGSDDVTIVLYGNIQNGIELSRDPETQDQAITDFVEEEFKKRPQTSGVIIKTENGVKYSNTNRVFAAIKKAYDTLGIEKPVMVAVEEPQ